MARTNLVKDDESYTFRSYFEMPYETDEILSAFDISLISKTLSLPRTTVPTETVEALKARLAALLGMIELANEMARREILVSPVLTQIVLWSGSRLRIEYPLVVSDQLKGKLDYLLEGFHRMLVVEAKNDDLSRGFTQLSVELIALSKRESTQDLLYGAVTIGNVWLFGWLDVPTQTVYRDISLYSVPNDLQDVMEILMGILSFDQPAVA